MHILAHFEHRFELVPAIARWILKVAADVAAGAKSPPVCSDDDGANRVVVARVGQRRENLVHHRLGIGIEFFGAVQGDDGDVPVFREKNLLIGRLAHRLGPSVDDPPSTTMVSPVVAGAWTAKKITASATSSPLAKCFRGVIFSADANASSVQPAKRVRTNPGSTALTRIPGASARASDLVMVTMPPFEAA